VTDATPFIQHAPKNVAENVRWRLKLRRAAMLDVDVRQALFDACMSDVLVFFNAFCWLIEPRAAVKIIPFVTWPHQDPVILAMDAAIDEAETSESPVALTMPKSRAQGATYAYICVLLRRFLRDPMFGVGLVTRNEKLVDSMTDQDTILWKVDWMLKQLPWWFLPHGYARSTTDHTITNPANGARFTGYAATGDVARGGRQTVFALDEFGSEEFIAGEKDYRVLSSISHVTNCMFLVSTYGSDAGAFYEAATDPENQRVVKLDWKDNPAQTKNAYIYRDGQATAVRPEEQPAVTRYVRRHSSELKKLARRGHQLENKFRSPWYDAYCLLPGATPRFIARELDMDPKGAVGKVFNVEVLDRMLKGDKTTGDGPRVQRPVWEGKPVLVNGRLHLQPQEGGPLKLWFKPGLDDASPVGRFVVGCDISTGSGGPDAGNSAMIATNCHSGEQLLEYADRKISETRFSRLAVAVCRWLHNAELIWESTGPTGQRFWNEVRELAYPNFWRSRKENQITSEITSKPGWANNKIADKAALFDHLWIAMSEGRFVPRSEDLIRDCAGWEWEEKQDRQPRIIFRGSGHGDRAIAGGLCWKVISDLHSGGVDIRRQVAQTAPVGSIAWFEMQDAARKRALEGWDNGVDFGLNTIRSEQHAVLGRGLSRAGIF
jgi:hypothetical protein